MNDKFIDSYKLVTDTIIAQLEKGNVPWRCPWRRNVGRPRNFHTGREYQGINVLLLSIRRFSSPYWMTWNQIKQRGGGVLKGEHGSLVVKYGQFKKKTSDNQPADEEKQRYYLKGYKVFNAVQIKDIEFPVVSTEPVPTLGRRIEMAEAIVASMQTLPEIREGRHTTACYRRLSDTIDMPEREGFDVLENFFLTLFHELVHSTGHESRLSRKSLIENDGFGGKVYSQEELVAEMGAAFLGTEADIVRDDFEQSAAYLKGWLDALRSKDHKRWIVQAANQAEKATDFILGRDSVSEATTESTGA